MSNPIKNNHETKKIQHATYEESRTGRPTTQKVRDYFNEHLNRPSSPQEDKEVLLSADAETHVTMWPRIGNQIPPSDNLPEMAAYLTQQRHLAKAACKEEKLVKSLNLSGSYLSLKDDEGKKAEKLAAAKPSPMLRRKPKFGEIVKEKLGTRSSNGTSKRTPDRGENLAKMRALQRQIKTGNLERVVPPPNIPSQEGRLAPPHSHFEDLARSSSSSKRQRKTKSSSSKLSEYIGTSADILDETRRAISGKFRPPFEHLSYPSFFLTRKASISSTASSESFYCVGEVPSTKETEANTEAAKALKKGQREDSTRLSGSGTNPWTNGPPEACRLCRKPGVGGIRGLCEACEREFMRPKPAFFEGEPESDEEEIKPTPPLKDRRTLSMRKEGSERKFAFHAEGEEGDQRPRVPVKDTLKLASAESKLKIVKPIPTPMKHSQQVSVEEDDVEEEDVEEENVEDEKFRRWQTKSMRADFEKTQKMFERWSCYYGNEDFAKFEEKSDLTPLIEGEREAEDVVKRHSSFYGFWTELLNDHRA
jgi:hypothetical protein